MLEKGVVAELGGGAVARGLVVLAVRDELLVALDVVVARHDVAEEEAPRRAHYVVERHRASEHLLQWPDVWVVQWVVLEARVLKSNRTRRD